MIAASDSIRDEVLAVATVGEVLRLAGHEASENLKKPLLCPFHAERSPSFFQQASGKGYRCQGCGARGGVFELAVALGLAPNMSRAVAFLGEHYRISKGSEPGSRPRRSVKPLALEVRTPAPTPAPTADEHASLDAALRDCRSLLGTPGAAYLKGRGFEPDAAEACGVLYHPQWLGVGPAVVFLGRDTEGHTVAAQGRFLQQRRLWIAQGATTVPHVPSCSKEAHSLMLLTRMVRHFYPPPRVGVPHT
jgi:hypothetical protein